MVFTQRFFRDMCPSSSRHGQCGVMVKTFDESGESWVTVDLEIGQLREYLRDDVAAL